MEYHVKLSQPLAGLGTIEAAIQAIDPAAQVDVDKPGRTLRVAAHIGMDELLRVLDRVGHPVVAQSILQQPSICCGGCGG